MRKLLFLLLLLPIVSSGYAWCNNDYEYYTTILITHDEIIEDYSVLLNVSYDSRVKEDFSDVIFYDTSCGLIPYYTQFVSNSSYALFWVKTDVLNGDVPIFMYYGNENAVSQSDFNNAFVFSDDFNDNNISSNWKYEEYNGNISEQNGVLNINCTVVEGVHVCTFGSPLKMPVIWYEYDYDYYEQYINFQRSGNWLGDYDIGGERDSFGIVLTNGGVNKTWSINGYNFTEIATKPHNLTGNTYIENIATFTDLSYSWGINDVGYSYALNGSCYIIRNTPSMEYVYVGNTEEDCINQNYTLIFNSSSLVGTPYNQTYLYYVLNVNGTGGVDFDNFRLRKYELVEPTYSFGSTFQYYNSLVQYGRSFGDFLTVIETPITEFVLRFIFISGIALLVGSIVTVIKTVVMRFKK